jgi:hypothetical protein
MESIYFYASLKEYRIREIRLLVFDVCRFVESLAAAAAAAGIPGGTVPIPALYS